MPEYLFIYFMKDSPEEIRETVPSHINYWKTVNPQSYKGGPFSDRTGGMITFKAQDMDKAVEICRDDPFIKKNLLEKSWVKEWLAE